MNWVLIVGGILLMLAGIVWTLQGLGILPGSVMSGVTFWAIVGPIVAVVGVGLLSWGVARRGRSSRP
ncbi:hypothetical protein [Agromyces sp. NPDC058104]|uniref:hypothetical protein n=1 Tax=Agromyces sp. NPDC058104 TaxID=3346342 RepID=UPI0036D9120F